MRLPLARSFVPAGLLSLFVSAVAADTLIRVQLAEVNEACSADAARLCAGVPAGGGRIAACLATQMPTLSRECHNALAVVAALKTCEIDQQRFCRDVLPGGGRVFVCLAQYSRELSQPCNAALKANVPGYRGY